MNSLIRVTFSISTIVFSILVLCSSKATTTDMSFSTTPSVISLPILSISESFKNNEDQTAYALGVSAGRYIASSLKEQEKLGIKLNKDQLIFGLKDVFNNTIKLSEKDIETILQNFHLHIKKATLIEIEKETKDNAAKGDRYRSEYAKKKGVKKTSTGILYKIDEIGQGNSPIDSDTVVVNYRGTLIDGTEFDNSYKRDKPLSFRLDNVIPGWIEGLKQIKKGGKIQLVIPPEQAYNKTGILGIPANSTLVFDVELLDIKPTASLLNTRTREIIRN